MRMQCNHPIYFVVWIENTGCEAVNDDVRLTILPLVPDFYHLTHLIISIKMFKLNVERESCASFEKKLHPILYLDSIGCYFKVCKTHISWLRKSQLCFCTITTFMVVLQRYCVPIKCSHVFFKVLIWIFLNNINSFN